MSTDQPLVLNKKAALAICDGDEELFLEIAEIFLEDAVEHLAMLKEAIAEKHADKIEKHGHAIKGAAGNICAHPTRDLAEQIEKAGRDNDLSEIVPLFTQLVEEFRRLKDYILSILPPKS